MRIQLPLGLFIAGAVTVATVVFAGDRLAFEAQALLLRPYQTYDGSYPAPEVMIQCDKPDCEAAVVFYEVMVDATGRPRALRFERAFRDDGTHVLKRSARTKAAKAALAARWPASESGQPVRAFQAVSIVPPERAPARHVPFPDTDGQAVSITLERAGPFSPYGTYVVTLDSDGDVDFCGPGYIKGPHQARISRAAFEALVQEFREADFFSLDDRYAANPGDGPAYFLRVRIGDREKTVVDYAGRRVGMPAVITSLQDAVDEAAETSGWVGSEKEWGSQPEEVSCPTPLSRIRATPS